MSLFLCSFEIENGRGRVEGSVCVAVRCFGLTHLGGEGERERKSEKLNRPAPLLFLLPLQ